MKTPAGRLQIMNSKKPAIIIDLDGTLCDSSHRKHHVEGPKKDWEAFYAGISEDKPNKILRLILRSYSLDPWAFLFVSGRPEKYRQVSQDWLNRYLHHSDYDLFMRPDGDFRADDIVKKEIYMRDIEPFYNVELCIDDRDRVVKMWRSLGLECWQVAVLFLVQVIFSVTDIL